MSFRENLSFTNPRRRIAAAGAVICFGLFATGVPEAAVAASPEVFLEDSSVIGVGDTITALRVPIRTADGKFIFKDVTIALDVDDKGNLRWASSKPIAKLSPDLDTANLRPGIYVSPSDSRLGLRITGPAPIGNGGEAEWAITVAPGKAAGFSPPNPAVFYTGPLAGNPLETRLKKAGLTSAQYSYGVIGTSNVASGFWASNGLIGVRLVGNQLVVASFTANGRDQRDPATQLIYTFLH